jgi:ribosomal protein S18 acetylase RimI-like enzyme
MTARFTIRPFAPADHGTVVDLKWEMSRYHADLQPTGTPIDCDYDNSREAAAAAITRDLAHIETKGGALLVAEADGCIVGYLSWYVDDRAGSATIRPERRPLAYVAGVSVTETRRGLGIGWALLTQAEAQARARGIARLGIGVRASNVGAVRLYEEFGFLGIELRMYKPLD